MKPDTCVIVSYYEALPIASLQNLLASLRATRPDRFDLVVVVNQTKDDHDPFLTAAEGFRVLFRENRGLNIGAWDHGWRQSPGYLYYLFLQEGCEVRDADWLERYRRPLSRRRGVVGDCLVIWPSWTVFENRYPPIGQTIREQAARRGWDRGKTPTHVQTVAVGARAAVLEALNGFPVSDDKIEAVGGEVLFSRRAVERGFSLGQVSWRHYGVFRHEQWDSLWQAGGRLTWTLARIVRLVFLRLGLS